MLLENGGGSVFRAALPFSSAPDAAHTSGTAEKLIYAFTHQFESILLWCSKASIG